MEQTSHITNQSLIVLKVTWDQRENPMLRDTRPIRMKHLGRTLDFYVFCQRAYLKREMGAYSFSKPTWAQLPW